MVTDLNPELYTKSKFLLICNQCESIFYICIHEGHDITCVSKFINVLYRALKLVYKRFHEKRGLNSISSFAYDKL